MPIRLRPDGCEKFGFVKDPRFLSSNYDLQCAEYLKAIIEVGGVELSEYKGYARSSIKIRLPF